MSAPAGLRLLVAGDFLHPHLQADLCDGLRAGGAEVAEFHALRWFGPGALLRRAQSKWLVGPGPLLARRALLARCAALRPDVLLAWRACWLDPETMARARAAGARRVVLYNNDDPFGPDRDLAIWRAWRRGVPAADLCLAYREVNLAELTAAGARAVAHFPASCAAWLLSDPPPGEAALTPYRCDLAFVGHYEPDGRAELVSALLGAGLSLRLHGPGWDAVAAARGWQVPRPIRPATGPAYALALRGARLGLVFLSGRNRDECTRRCFELPALGVTMLAPRTPALAALYRDGEEAVLYGSAAELVERARHYLARPAERASVAAAGRRRCRDAGYDTPSAARRLLARLAALP